MHADSRFRLIRWSHAGSCERLHLSFPERHGMQLSCDRARFCLRCAPFETVFNVCWSGAFEIPLSATLFASSSIAPSEFALAVVMEETWSKVFRRPFGNLCTALLLRAGFPAAGGCS